MPRVRDGGASPVPPWELEDKPNLTLLLRLGGSGQTKAYPRMAERRYLPKSQP